jgi:hypothetical protein
MPLRQLTISLFVALLLSAGLGLSAHAAGVLVGRGAEGIAAGLISVAPPGEQAAVLPGIAGQASTALPTPSPIAEPQKPIKRPAAAKAVAKRGVQAPPRLSPSVGDKPIEVSAKAPPRPAEPPSIPILTARADAPFCDGVYVYIVTSFERPSDSVATISVDAKERGRQRRVGQRVGPYEVIAIGYNRGHASSAVWLAKGQRVCQALVQDANPVRVKAHQKQLARARAKASNRRAQARKRARARQRKARQRKLRGKR